MMRKMMAAASLVAIAACGSSELGGDDDAGMPGPTGCEVAADCEDGQACDLGTHACVTGMLAIDAADFAVDGSVWWTQTSTPTLRGTFSGVANATISAHVGASTAAATIEGQTWSVTLPADAIASTDTIVTIAMSDPSGGLVELSQTFRLDTLAPTVALGVTKVRDERGDSVDFSSGQPIHTHAGAEVDLSAPGCPSVYRYAYLLGTPLYGLATSSNPLSWRFRVVDAHVQPDSPMFRVRTDAGQTLIDWAALPAPDAAGYSTVTLTPATVPLLASRDGRFYIDLRARDWNDLEGTASACFDNHLLAAPVFAEPIAKGSLFDMSLPGDSAVSSAINDGVVIVSQRIVQQTAEPVTVAWSMTAGSYAFSARSLTGMVTEVTNGNYFCQPGNSEPRCRVNWSPPAAAPATLATITGNVAMASWVVLVDETTDRVLKTAPAASGYVAVNWGLPARAANEPAHSYRLDVLAKLDGFTPPPTSLFPGPVGENTAMGVTYTGYAAEQLGVSCANMQQTAFGPLCAEMSYFWNIGALDHAHADFAPFDVAVATSRGDVTLAYVSYLGATARSTGPLAWDAGDDDLPGPN